MCNNHIKLKLFNIPQNYVEVTHFYSMKSCFFILLFYRAERNQQLTKSVSIRRYPNDRLVNFPWSMNQENSPFPEIRAKCLTQSFRHCPMRICAIIF